MREYTYYICDVFTRQRFEGNELAVIPDAAGLSAEEMQKMAREFNFSESTFVFPPEKNGTRKVRIFTPSSEIPFAGHPNIGTAFVLASVGELLDSDEGDEVVFEELAGSVPITIEKDDAGEIWCELEAPETLSLGQGVPSELVAKALSIGADDIKVGNHAPMEVSAGFPFVVVELEGREILDRLKVNLDGFEGIASLGVSPLVYAYVRGESKVEIHARVFAPLEGIPEDSATGSANCALAGLLTHLNPEIAGSYEWRIFQGYQMGRPSQLEARTKKENGEVSSIWIGGYSVMVASGVFSLD